VSTPLQFVVLRHTGVPTPHFDVMLERAPGEALLTWRAPSWPMPVLTVLTPLDDHRAVYLDYEGPVSGGRGQVQRLMHSIAQVSILTTAEGTEHWTLSFDRSSPPFSCRLNRDVSGCWTGQTSDTP